MIAHQHKRITEDKWYSLCISSFLPVGRVIVPVNRAILGVVLIHGHGFLGVVLIPMFLPLHLQLRHILPSATKKRLALNN